MIQDYLELMRHFIATYGLVAIFVLGFAEEIIIFIPSSIIFIATGFLLINPQAAILYAIVSSIFMVGIPGALGVTFGSFLFYWLVYWGGKPLVVKWGRYIHLNWGHIETLNKKFASGYIDEITLLFLRALPILPVSTITIFCGLIRLKWREFLFITFTGTLLRVSGLSLFGWYLGKEYEKYAWQIAAFEKYFIVALAALLVFGLLYFYRRQKNLKVNEV